MKKVALTLLLICAGAACVLVGFKIEVLVNKWSVNTEIMDLQARVAALEKRQSKEIVDYSDMYLFDTVDDGTVTWAITEDDPNDDGMLWVEKEDGTLAQMHYLAFHESIKKK